MVWHIISERCHQCYSTPLHCTALRCTLLYCITHHTTPHHTTPHHYTAQHSTLLYYTPHQYTTLYCTRLGCTNRIQRVSALHQVPPAGCNVRPFMRCVVIRMTSSYRHLIVPYNEEDLFHVMCCYTHDVIIQTPYRSIE